MGAQKRWAAIKSGKAPSPFANGVWREAGLKPHRLERYLASDDPDFESKAIRRCPILGIVDYEITPRHEAVFCIDDD